jgi:hypothetical protein
MRAVSEAPAFRTCEVAIRQVWGSGFFTADFRAALDLNPRRQPGPRASPPVQRLKKRRWVIFFWPRSRCGLWLSLFLSLPAKLVFIPEG